MHTQTRTRTPTITETERANRMEPWFKVVRVGSQGGLYSALAGKYNPCEDYTRVSYELGEISMAPPKGKGLYIYRTLRWAKKQADRMSTNNGGAKMAVYEVATYGAKLDRGMENRGQCKELLMLAKVYETGRAAKPPVRWTSISPKTIGAKVKFSNTGNVDGVALIDTTCNNEIAVVPMPKLVTGNRGYKAQVDTHCGFPSVTFSCQQ